MDGKHAYDLSDLRAVIGSKTFALYAGLFANSNKGDMSLFDYLRINLGSIRVSDRVPGVSSSAQKGIAVLSASAEMPKIHVWSSLEIVRDPYSGAGCREGHHHRDGVGLAIIRATRHEPDQGSSPEAQLRAGGPDGFASRASARVPGDLLRR